MSEQFGKQVGLGSVKVVQKLEESQML